MLEAITTYLGERRQRLDLLWTRITTVPAIETTKRYTKADWLQALYNSYGIFSRTRNSDGPRVDSITTNNVMIHDDVPTYVSWSWWCQPGIRFNIEVQREYSQEQSGGIFTTVTAEGGLDFILVKEEDYAAHYHAPKNVGIDLWGQKITRVIVESSEYDVPERRPLLAEFRLHDLNIARRVIDFYHTEIGKVEQNFLPLLYAPITSIQ